jgi:hypothetical protein
MAPCDVYSAARFFSFAAFVVVRVIVRSVLCFFYGSDVYGSDDQNFFNHKLCATSLPATRALLMRRLDA